MMDMDKMTKYRAWVGDPHSIRSEVLECLIDGLQFLKSDAEVPAQKLANRILANIIIEHLDISGFRINRKEPQPEPVAGPDRLFSMSAN